MAKTGTPNPQLQENLLKYLLQYNLEEFRKLLFNPAVIPDYKYGDPHYSTCLELACRREGTKDFIYLLLKRVKPYTHEIHLEPIHYAARMGNSEALEVLLKDKRINVNVEDTNGRTALHLAVSHFKVDKAANYKKCITLLMSHPNSSINTPNKTGYTALHLAVILKCKQAVQNILECGQNKIDLDTHRAKGRTAREAIWNEYPEIGKDLPLPIDTSDPHFELYKALKKRNMELFRALLRQQDSDGNPVLNPNYWYDKPFDTTILEMACREDTSAEFVKIALQAGTDPNRINEYNEKSPIHVAAEVGNYNALRALLSNKLTDINVTDKLGKSALHYTVVGDCSDEEYNDRLECLKILLENDDLEINMEDNDGHSAIYLALSSDNKYSVITMLEQEKHPLDIDSIVDLTHGTMRDMITATYSDLNNISPRHTEKQVRRKNMKTELFEYLRKNQKDKFISTVQDKKDSDEFKAISSSLLQYSCENGLADCIKELLDVGSDPNAVTATNKSPPLVLVCEKKHFDIVTWLREEKDLKINAKDMRENSALHYAVWNEHLETVISLINSGADLELKNSFGKPPLCRKRLETLLDKCIKTNEHHPLVEDYEVIFDYRLLTAYSTIQSPSKFDSCCTQITIGGTHYNAVNNTNVTDVNLTPEMNLLYFISQCEELRDLLHHPVARTFLEFKSRVVTVCHFINLFLYVLFLMFLNTYVFFVQMTPKNETDTNMPWYGNASQNISWYKRPEATTVTLWFTAVFLIMIFIRELVQFVMSWKDYKRNGENIIDLAIIVSTTIILSRPDALKIFFVMALLLAWIELILLLGRFQTFSNYIEIFKVVLFNYCSISVLYFILILAFSLCFHILFIELEDKEDGNWYKDIPLSLLKTFIMMTGEFDVKRKTFDGAPPGASIFFVLFVVIMTIVLLNLLIALVADTQSIRKDATLFSLGSRVKVIAEVESILISLHKCLKRIGCCFCYAYLSRVSLFRSIVEKKEASLKPNASLDIILSSNQDSFILDRDLFEKSVLIINKDMSIRQPSSEDCKFKKLQKSMDRLINILDGAQREGIDFSRRSQISGITTLS